MTDPRDIPPWPVDWERFNSRRKPSGWHFRWNNLMQTTASVDERDVPNAFHRLMQKWLLGIEWKKVKP